MAGKGVLNLSVLDAAMKRVAEIAPRPSRAHVSSDTVDALAYASRAYSDNPILRGEARPFAGIDIVRSSAFPMDAECKACGGSGEGTNSTYCHQCGGTGMVRYVGIMTGGAPTTRIGLDFAGRPSETIFVTDRSPHPKKFQPSFPKGLVPQPPMCKGLP